MEDESYICMMASTNAKCTLHLHSVHNAIADKMAGHEGGLFLGDLPLMAKSIIPSSSNSNQWGVK